MWRICLMTLCATATALGAGRRPTYTQDVARIMIRACVACHHGGGAAPFSLTTYDEVRRHAAMIALVTEDRYMPPQRNDPTYRTFAHERRLSDADIAVLQAWLADSMPEGPRKAMPKVPVHDGGSQRPGRADLVLRMRSDVPVPGTNDQHYICYAIPFELDAERHVRAVEYVPGNRRLTHHASYQVLEVAPDVSLDSVPEYFVYGQGQPIDDGNDYAYFGLVSPRYGPPVETFHAGWLPGMSPIDFPDGIGFRMPRRGVLLIRNLHYAPTPVDTVDRALLRFHYSDRPCRTIVFAGFRPTLPDSHPRIIPADSVVEHRIVVRLRDSVSLLTINPHMHLLGRSVRVWARTPAGDSVPLISIPVWDFDWQDFYRYPRPVVLPAGTVITGLATFDNTDRNSRNPYHPPRDVPFEGAMDDTSEMFRLVLLMLPYQYGDEGIEMDGRPLRGRGRRTFAE